MHEIRTYKAQLIIAADRLKHAGLDKPTREARHLMQYACGISAADLISEELSEMPDAACQAFFDLIERRAAGEPYEYLTGEAHFYGLRLACSNATLIPRPDSEVVVDEALARLPLGRARAGPPRGGQAPDPPAQQERPRPIRGSRRLARVPRCAAADAAV